MMITANQAREISGPTLEESIEYHLEVISEKIQKSAERKNRKIVIKEKPYCDWAYNSGNPEEVGEAVFDKLKKAGFKVSTYYREMQFVDYGLQIEW